MIDASHSHPLLITLFGGFKLHVQGQLVTNIPRKGQALLAHLAMQDGQPVSREAMADLLWSLSGSKEARHSLRDLLLRMRATLRDLGDDSLPADVGSIAFRPGAVSCDVVRFHHLAAANGRSDLAEAVELYRGPLMHGFAETNSIFDDRLIEARAKMAAFAVDVLARLADACTAAGDGHAAVLAIERMLEIDPLREESYRRLMAAYVAIDRPADAIRQYNACAERLRRDLDVGPSAETEAMIWRIRSAPASNGSRLARQDMVFAQPSSGPPWIAVLPFRALGPSAVPEYFATGLVEDLVCTLATLREPIVVSSNSTLMYRNQPIDLRRVGRELGVRYVASGSIRKAGSQLRIAVELAEAENGAVLWGDHYDVEALQLFDAQDSIVAKIVAVWLPKIHEAELRRVRAKRPETLTSYDLVLQARSLIFQLQRDSFEQAEGLLNRAAALDPNYATAHATMADLLNLRVGQGWSPNVAADAQAVDRVAQTAIASDPFNARALAIYGHNRAYLHRDYDHAVALFDRALDSSPNDATGWMWSVSTHAYIGEGADAVRRAERALKLSPRDPFLFRFYTSLCLAHYTNGTYEEAVHWGFLGLREAPTYTANLRFTAASLVELGRVDEARQLAAPIMRLQPGFNVRWVIDRHPYRDLERRQKIALSLIEAGLPE